MVPICIVMFLRPFPFFKRPPRSIKTETNSSFSPPLVLNSPSSLPFFSSFIHFSILFHILLLFNRINYKRRWFNRKKNNRKRKTKNNKKAKRMGGGKMREETKNRCGKRRKKVREKANKKWGNMRKKVREQDTKWWGKRRKRSERYLRPQQQRGAVLFQLSSSLRNSQGENGPAKKYTTIGIGDSCRRLETYRSILRDNGRLLSIIKQQCRFICTTESLGESRVGANFIPYRTSTFPFWIFQPWGLILPRSFRVFSSGRGPLLEEFILEDFRFSRRGLFLI